MLFAIFNNITELVLAGTWTVIVFHAGNRFGRWWERRKSARTVA